jgi:hypothetical protein
MSLGFLINISAFQNQVHHGDTRRNIMNYLSLARYALYTMRCRATLERTEDSEEWNVHCFESDEFFLWRDLSRQRKRVFSL